MQVDLLGYLLGALDEAERAEVEAALEENPELAAKCAQLEQKIAPLSEDESWIDPPGRLAERTIAFVEACAAEDASEENAAEDVSDEVLQRRNSSLDALLAGLPAREVGASDPIPTQTNNEVTLSPVNAREYTRPRRWSLADAIVATGICIAAAMLFIPAIAQSQRQAAISTCQNKLRELGHALVNYTHNNGGQFPLVPTGGNLGVAGIYAPLLKEAGQIEDDSVFVCPSSALAENVNDFKVPSIEELEQQSGKTLQKSQRTMGGSFGYAFGYEDDDAVYRANLNRSRPQFAILADSPSLHLKDRQSANHGGRGQNVLFEDGHVGYLKHCRAQDASDNVFLSDRGYVEAGRHWNDAVIGNSWARPVLQAR